MGGQYDIYIRGRCHDGPILYVYTRNKLTELDIIVEDIPKRWSAKAIEHMLLLESIVDVEMQKMSIPKLDRISLSSTENILTEKVGSEHLDEYFYLSDVLHNEHATKKLYALCDDIILSCGLWHAAREKYMPNVTNTLVLENSDVSYLFCKIVGGRDEIVLSSSNTVPSERKNVSLLNNSILYSVASIDEENFVSSPSCMFILGQNKANASLTRYRMLFEVDTDYNSNEHNIFDYDSMTIEDVDYVTLE